MQIARNQIPDNLPRSASHPEREAQIEAWIRGGARAAHQSLQVSDPLEAGERMSIHRGSRRYSDGGHEIVAKHSRTVDGSIDPASTFMVGIRGPRSGDA